MLQVVFSVTSKLGLSGSVFQSVNLLCYSAVLKCCSEVWSKKKVIISPSVLNLFYILF